MAGRALWLGLRMSLVACLWEMQVEGGVTSVKGFYVASIYGGLRANGKKPDLALVACDIDATVAGAFTTNAIVASPFLYCKNVLSTSGTVLTTDAQVTLMSFVSRKLRWLLLRDPYQLC